MVFVPVGIAGAQPMPVGTGTPTCTGAWTGSLYFSPALKNGGTATFEEVSIKAKARPCTGGIPVPVKGKITGKGEITGAGADSCTQLAGMTFASPGFYEHIKWTPPETATTLFFPSFATATVAGHLVISGGPVAAAGSYVNPTATQALTTVLTTTAIATLCGSSSGVTSLNIGTVPSTGTY